MNRQVVGFLVDKPVTAVLLVHKNRPDWQAGRLNGIGGKVEDGEDWLAAMDREFREETDGGAHEWVHFASMQRGGDRPYEVRFYYAVGEPWRVSGRTDERVEVLDVRQVTDGFKADVFNAAAFVDNVAFLVYRVMNLVSGANNVSKLCYI